MSKCSILVDSLEGVLVSEDYLRGYLEAFGVVSDSISQTESGRSTVTCDRCYDILDRLTTMNADHQKPSHKGRKLRFQLVSERDPLSVRDCMGQQPSNELVVSGFSVDNVSQSDLTGLFGLYGTIVFFELRDDTATVEYSKFESAVAALAALDGGFFRGGFLSVQYSQDLRGGGVAALHASRPSLFAASRDSSWNSRTWDNYAAVDNVTSDGILQMSNKTEAEEFLSLSRLSESKSASFSYAQSNHQDVADALPAAAGEVNSPRVELSISDEDAGSVISLESTSASSILSTLDTDDSRFRDTQHTDWLKSSDRAESKTALNIDVAWLKSSEVHQQESEEKLGINSQHFQGHSGFSTLAPGLVAPTLQYSDSECIFESFLSFDPTDLEDSNPFDNNEINQADFEPLVIDLADAEISDVKCAITGTSMSAAQYGQYLNMVNAYFSETAFANSGGQNAGGRFSECLTASSTAASFPDLRDNLIGLSLKHDTPEFVPKSQQKSDADNGSVVSGGYVKRVTKSTDPEDMSEGGEYDEMGSLGAKGEYSIHSGQFEADIRNIFVGNIGRLMSDGVHQLKSYFSALNIIVLKVDIKISFAFLEVKNTPMLQSQIDAIALGSGGKPPPFGKDERMLRIEFVQQSSAGKRSIRLRRECQQSPTSSLFIVGFDHRRTPTSLLNSVYSPFGPLEYVEIKNNYAFVKFVNVADAIKAQESTHGMSIQERTLSVEFSSRHLAGDRSVSSDGGDIDGKQVGSASISSRENSLASDSQRNQANKNHRDGAAHRAHPDRTEGGRGYYCGNNTRYCESYESKNPSPVVPRHHRMSPSKTDRFYRHGHIDTTIGNHAYNEHLSVPLLPPPSRMDLAPSFSGYVDHYLPCPPMQDFDRPIEYTYPTIPPHSDIPSSGSIGADRWLPHSPHRGERGQPHVSRDSSIHHLEWRRYGGTHSGLGNPHPYSGGMRHPPNPSGPVDRLQKYSY